MVKDIYTTKNKYKIIYADPPWKYGDKRNKSGGADQHYKTMTLNDIAKLPIKNIVEKNAVLFLWTTSPFLQHSFEIIKSWGFEYKTTFVWDKVRSNLGHYNSASHEFLLVCGRGSSIPQIKKLYDSVQVIPASKKHSQKPQEFIDIINTLYPIGKRIELFAREEQEGWDSWGNEL